jgi:hypothetical protein
MSDEGGLSVPADLPGDGRLRVVLARMLRRTPSERFGNARDVKHAVLGAGTGVAEAGGWRPPTVGPGPGGAAVIPMGSLRTGVSPLEDEVLALPTPRDLRGPARKLLKHAAPSAMQLMDGSTKKGDRPGVSDYAIVVFFSVLTCGILPITFTAIARSRRRRLRRFIRDGIPGVAVITEITTEKGPFESPISNVRYEFGVDGVAYRDVDQVRPAVANRWRAGDAVRILYLPDSGYDSVILSSS